VLDLPDEVLADPVWERSGHTDRGRDGCRVPIPWTEQGPSLGFGEGGSWLPQPSHWSGLSAEAQRGEPGSTLELYREALRLRRENRAGALRWHERDGAALSFDNGAIGCVTNFGSTPVPVSGE